jgi:hypothetical protein
MNISSQTALAGLALVGLIGLSFAFAFHKVPTENHDFMIFTLGALAGAITVGGGKLADKITSSSGPDATIQSEAADPDKQP